MYLCVMKRDVVTERAVEAVAGVAEDLTTDPVTVAVEAVAAKPEVVEKQVSKCMVENDAARMAKFMSEGERDFTYYEIQFDENLNPLLSLMAIARKETVTTERAVLQNAQGNEL